jgi:hypothetical protein
MRAVLNLTAGINLLQVPAHVRAGEVLKQDAAQPEPASTREAPPPRQEPPMPQAGTVSYTALQAPVLARAVQGGSTVQGDSAVQNHAAVEDIAVQGKAAVQGGAGEERNAAIQDKAAVQGATPLPGGGAAQLPLASSTSIPIPRFPGWLAAIGAALRKGQAKGPPVPNARAHPPTTPQSSPQLPQVGGGQAWAGRCGLLVGTDFCRLPMRATT